MAGSRPISRTDVLEPAGLGQPRRLGERSNVWLATGGCLLLVGTAAVAVPAYRVMLPAYAYAFGDTAAPTYAFLGAAPAVVLVAAGLLARWSHPASRIGLLLILEGLAWNLNPIILSADQLPAATELATITTYISYAIGAQVLLSYPSGHLRRAHDRRLVLLLYIVFGPAIVVCSMFHRDYGPGCPFSPANGFLIAPQDTLDIVLNSAWFIVSGGLMAIAGLRSVPRWRSATPVARRSLAPVYVTRWLYAGAIVLWCGVGAAVAFADVTKPSMFLQAPINIAAMASAGGIVLVFLRTTTAKSAAGKLALDLDKAPMPAARLEEAVRSALGDPSARLLFRADGGTSWVDTHGAVVTPHEMRSITTFDAMSGSALEHDSAFDDDPVVVEAVGAVAGLALEAERLRVLLRAAGGPDRTMPGNKAALRGLLTPREREVLALVAEGLTDGAIAQRLYLTRRTVETHLGHIFTKLGVPSGSSQNRRVHAVRRYLDATELKPDETTA